MILKTSKRTLTDNQVQILMILYKFRFATTQLIARHKNKHSVTVHQSLKTLEKRQFIAKHYDSSYRLLGRGAEYYLSSRGIKYLKDNADLSHAVLHSLYHNRTASQAYIKKSLLIYQVYLQLQRHYPGLSLMTKSETHNADGFLSVLPDLYLRDEKDNDYLLEIFTENLFFYSKKRTDQLIKHHEEDYWPEDTPPTLLFVLPNKTLEKKTQAYIQKTKEDNYIEDDELVFMTTTLQALQSGVSEIWNITLEDGPRAL